MDVEAERNGGSFDRLCSTLDLTKENGLVELDSDTDDEFQRYILKQAKEKLDIDAIFFLKPEIGPSIPLIYFRKLESRDSHKIAELHQLIWNMGQAPLLFVALPDAVLIYNAYEPPKKLDDGQLDDQAGFIEELELYVEAEAKIKKRMKYHRSELVTGSYWQKHGEQFKKEKRAYQTLLHNLDFMREKLIEQELPPNIVHKLLNRSIFIKYLEDRKDKEGHNVFPEGYFAQHLPGAKCFTDLLSDRGATYSLFRDLNDKFNGDIFIINREEEKTTQEHLILLRRLLKGDAYLDSGQMALWPLYSFDVIPIELISNIYQQFLHHEINNETTGQYYTPCHLVTFLMDEVLPWNGDNIDLKVFDPSCGSGVFLVEAYRRLISRWMQANPGQRPLISDLTDILTKNIFGVDIDGKAIRIAALSLYLTMCDYLEPRQIWEGVKSKPLFKPLINNNLFESDFFEKDALFSDEKYDLIIGNPPWQSELSEPARIYTTENNKPVGDNQICQAFLWRVGELCKPDGKICMVVSSKGLLFNRSTPNREFRKQFFSSFDVKTIINFSALRHVLFSKAVAPCAAVVFSPDKTEDSQPIFYCSPKPSHSPQDDWLLVIEPHDIAHISKDEAIESDIIWKVAMWGNPRDYELIKRLSKQSNLREICEKNGWIDGEGFIVGNRRYEDLSLFGKPYVDVRKLQRFTVDEGSLPSLDETRFIRSRTKKSEIFKGPHLLIKQSPKAGVGLIAALLKNDAVFRHSILGIHGKEKDLNQLALCCSVINTKIALYYEMLTSRRWLVERDEFEKEEIMNLPMPKNLLDQTINYEFLKNLSKNPEANEIINELVANWFDIAETDMILINDTIDVTLDYFRRKNKSAAVEPVTEMILGDYSDIFCKVLNNSFSSQEKVFAGTVFLGESPLQVVSVRLVDESEEAAIKTQVQEHELKDVLNKLDKILIEERSPSIYIRRNLRRYSGHKISIIKPNQKRYWTKSAALRDADETYADIMLLWRDLE
jgi:type I restriction-modification system DNA methylase subunit